MKDKIKAEIIKVLTSKGISIEDFIIETPNNKELGDYSSNVALKLSKKNNMNSLDLANLIIDNFKLDIVNKLEVKNPGFINFFVSKDYLLDNINTVIKLKDNYGRINLGNNEKINIEFVSANPTGILHIGNARGGAYGDNLSRILEFAGYDVTREYYVNDSGNQVNNLGKSLKCRYLEVCGEEVSMPENGYFGDDIKQLANKLYEEKGNELINNDLEFFKEYGINYLLNKIISDLKEYGINYDVLTSEKEIKKLGYIEKILAQYKEKEYSYENDGALWFKGTSFGATRDFVLVKNDGEYTYVVPDIAHYVNNYEKNYAKLINVLGADHHGYVSVIKSTLKALKLDTDKIDIKLLQLVKLIKDGEEVRMSKRTGNVFTLKELIEEVGVNAARYFFASRSLDTQMDFNMDLAKKESSENPVYYVCYAYARICSILANVTYNELPEKYTTISSKEAYNVLEKVYNFSEVVTSAATKELPHLIANYTYELANLFHIYYSTHRIITDDEKYTKENINLIKAVQITLKNALALIGVNPPEKM